MRQQIESFLKASEAEKRYKASYLRTLRCILPKVAELFPDPKDITTEDWRAYQILLHDEGKTWAYICRITSAVKALLRHHGIDFKPWVPRLRAIQEEAAGRRALEGWERDALLEALMEIDGEAWRWYVVAFYVGLRKSEIDYLAPGWIDWREATVTVPAVYGKGGKTPPRHVPSPALWALAFQIAGMVSPKSDRPIFGRKDRRRVFAAAAEKIGLNLTGVTASHTARHTRATQLIRAGSILAAQAQLGHKHMQTTMRYAHVTLEHAREAGRKADE